MNEEREEALYERGEQWYGANGSLGLALMLEEREQEQTEFDRLKTENEALRVENERLLGIIEQAARKTKEHESKMNRDIWEDKTCPICGDSFRLWLDDKPHCSHCEKTFGWFRRLFYSIPYSMIKILFLR